MCHGCLYGNKLTLEKMRQNPINTAAGKSRKTPWDSQWPTHPRTHTRRLWYFSYKPLASTSVTGVVEVEWLQWIPMILWFKHTPPCDHTIGEEGKKKKIEIVLPLVSTDFREKSLSHSKSWALTVGVIVCAWVRSRLAHWRWPVGCVNPVFLCD